MATERTIKVPDIGDFDSVEVIEVLVSPGDTVEVEQSLITLESDKATMEIPAPFAGVVKQVSVSLGDQVAEGTTIVILEVSGDSCDEHVSYSPVEDVLHRYSRVHAGQYDRFGELTFGRFTHLFGMVPGGHRPGDESSIPFL